MRTTLNLDEDVLQAVRELAAARGRTTGQVVSELVRQALAPARAGRVRNGVPLMPRVRQGAAPITIAKVNRLRDE